MIIGKFNYSTKEFSQDAVIAWLLDSTRWGNKVEKEMGNAFVRDLIFKGGCEPFQVITVIPQFRRIDVLAFIYANNKIHPVVIENKTSTFLRAKQCEDYCKIVSDPINNVETQKRAHELKDFRLSQLESGSADGYGKIYYILYKTGYIHDYDVETYQRQRKETKTNIPREVDISDRPLDLNDMISFFERFKDNGISLVLDYYDYLCNLKVQQDRDKKDLSTSAGQNEWFKMVFRNHPKPLSEVLYQNNRNGTSFTTYIVKTHNIITGEPWERYCSKDSPPIPDKS